MFEALLVFSRQGTFKEKISSQAISSREHARKLFPLVTPSLPHRIVTWVSPSVKNGKVVKRGHFKKLTNTHKFNPKQLFEQEEAERIRTYGESPEHKLAKKLIASELNRRLQAQLALPWVFTDKRASDFHLTGNLLLGAHKIELEQKVTTPFGNYQLDIAILGHVDNRSPVIIGGIEVERTHAFDGRKALILKSQAFALISVDISEMSLDQMTPNWAENILTATSRNEENHLRKTFIYLHDILYPLYMKLPDFIDTEHRHQYIVFASDAALIELKEWLKKIQNKLDLPAGALLLNPVNAKSEQSRKMLENAGNITGYDWQTINNQQCLRVIINKPINPLQTNLYLFHIWLARILLTHINALVGYKYANRIDDGELNEDIWIFHKSQRKYRVLPKRLAEPANTIFETLSKIDEDMQT